MEAEAILTQRLDKLIVQFKSSNPDFFTAYNTARSVVDLRASRKPNQPEPTPAPQPA